MKLNGDLQVDGVVSGPNVTTSIRNYVQYNYNGNNGVFFDLAGGEQLLTNLNNKAFPGTMDGKKVYQIDIKLMIRRLTGNSSGDKFRLRIGPNGNTSDTQVALFGFTNQNGQNYSSTLYTVLVKPQIDNVISLTVEPGADDLSLPSSFGLPDTLKWNRIIVEEIGTSDYVSGAYEI